VPGYGPVALKTGLETRHNPQQVQVGVQQRTHSTEIVVPAPILEDGQQLARLLAGLDELLRLGDGGGHRLVDDDGQPGV